MQFEKNIKYEYVEKTDMERLKEFQKVFENLKNHGFYFEENNGNLCINKFPYSFVMGKMK